VPYNTAPRMFSTLMWVKTALSGNMPLVEFTANEGAEVPEP